MEERSFRAINDNAEIYVNNGSQNTLNKVFNLLRSRGFTVQTDQRILEEYPILADSRWEGFKKDLLFKAKIYPAGFELVFYQEINTKNRNGGYYDFEKFELMPYLTRCEYTLTRKHICELLEDEGYKNTTKPEFDTAFDEVMYRIKDCIHYEEGKELPEFDIPDYNSRDKNDKQLRNGQVKYFRDRKGRLMRGTIYHNINNMWWVILNKHRFTNVASFQLFDLDDEESRQRRVYSREIPYRIRAEKLRKKFKDDGLDYSMINEEHILYLRLLLSRELETYDHLKMCLKAPLVKDVKVLKRTGLRHAEIKVNSHYFTGREAITFNENGFIGFAGWASDYNLKPFVDAFDKWIDWLKDCKKQPA